MMLTNYLLNNFLIAGMVDRDGDGMLDYQEFINLFMQKLEI
jgi:hypothetical protein